MTMRDNDRRRSRREAFEDDKAAKDAGDTGFFKGSRVTIPDADLAKLGLSEYKPLGGEKGEAMQHAVHLLPVHPDDKAANMDVIALPLYYHFGIGPNNETFICPRSMSAFLRSKQMPVPKAIQDGRCPCCDKMDTLIAAHIKNKNVDSQEARDARWNEIKELHPFSGSYKAPKPKRFFAWVVDASNEQTEDEGVKYWLMPTSVYYDGVIFVSENDDGEFRDLVDAENGYTFRFKRAGKGKEDTTYSEFRAKPRKYSMADWAKDVPRFFDVLCFKTYDEIAAIMSAEPEPKPESESDKTESGNDKARSRRREAEEVADEAERAFKGDKDDNGDAGEEADERPRQRRRPTTEPNPTTPARGAENTTKAGQKHVPHSDDNEVSPEIQEIRRRRRERLEQEKKGE